MRASFDLYVRRESWIHRLDPRVKLAFVVIATFVVFLFPSLWTALFLIALCTGLLLWANIPHRQVVHAWRNMGSLMLAAFFLTALFGADSGTVLLKLGPISISEGALWQGALLATRLLALGLVFTCWLYTTDQASMVRSFTALGLPYEWGLMVALALRYLPVFAGLLVQVREAQEARGLDLQQYSFGGRLRAYSPVLIAMVIAALRKSEQLGWALEARALGAGETTRTTLHPLRMQAWDWAVLLLLLMAAAIALVLRIL